MNYRCLVLLLLLSPWAFGQGKPLAERVKDLEQLVERLNERVLTLEAVNRVLADERKALRDSLFVVTVLKEQYQRSPGAAPATTVQTTPGAATRPQAAPGVPEGPASSLAVTPEPEAKPTQPLKASAAPAVRSTSVAPKPAAPRARSSYRTYIRGPRGGCYYINSNGNKTYVDRSMCG